MEHLQDILDRMASGQADAAPGEYEGPVTVRYGGVLDGHGATLWAAKGPALLLAADGATIRNLRVEVVSDPEHDVAIAGGGHAAVFENVEVHGEVTDVPGVQGDWHLPGSAELGAFAPDETNVACLPLALPEDAELTCLMDGVQAEPAHLAAGHPCIVLTIDGMRAGTSLYGDLLLKSGGLVRRICVSGQAIEGAARRQDQPPSGSDSVLPSENATSRSDGREKNTGEVRPDATHDSSIGGSLRPSSASVLTAVRGQRVSVQDDVLTIRYEDGGRPGGADIDAYVFALDQTGKTRGDGDFYFFGHRDGEAVALAEQPGGPDTVQITLSKVPADIQRLVVSYAIYDDDGSAPSFSAVRTPVVHVTGAGQEAVFPLTGLSVEKTVEAVEIYRRNGAWKVHFIGAGYKDGLARLCESYGLEVEG